MAYTRVNWQDLPSTTTPRNATNLNKMDSAIKEHDDKLLGNTSMGNVVVDSIRSKNIFNVKTCVGGNLDNGAVVGSDKVNISSTNAETGTIVYTSTEAWRGVVSAYIEVDEGEQYILNYTRSSNAILSFVVYYNSSKQVVGNTTEITYQQPMTIPTSVKYIRFILEPSSVVSGNITLSNIQFEKGSSATTFSPYQELKPTSILSSAQYNSTNLATPLYNKIARTGNVVHIYFLTKINSVGSGNWDVLTNLPTNIFEINYRFFAYKVDDEHLANPTHIMAWTQVDGTSIRIFSGNLTANKYIYINLTYITKD